MERRICMSSKELNRLEELRKVHQKQQTISQVAEKLGLSTRQVKRLSKRLKTEGAEGLISKKVGKSGNHRLVPGLKEAALGLIQDCYEDFGPTLAHEYLAEKHHFSISISSVRSLMIAAGIWKNKKQRKLRVFRLRPRRACEGELIQLDGSEHEWFEGRGPYCTLLSYIDDATSKIMFLRFAKSESVWAYFEATQMYIEKHGRPQTLYPDKHSVFRVNREGALSGTGLTQFGRAMEELDIQLICANTPQAKGRVERRHRDLQDRLIKAMRLQKISTLEEANAFLPSFIEDFNKRFGKEAQNPSNAHRPLLDRHILDRIFCLKEKRYLSKNLTLQYKTVIYQVITDRPGYAMKKKEVEILESKKGKIIVEYKSKPLTVMAYNQMQGETEIVSAKELTTVLKEKKKYRPARHHPWKRAPRGFSNRQKETVCCS